MPDNVCRLLDNLNSHLSKLLDFANRGLSPLRSNALNTPRNNASGWAASTQTLLGVELGPVEGGAAEENENEPEPARFRPGRFCEIL